MCNLSPCDNFIHFLEGGISSLQAYQVLRNCGSELLYEKPESRVELAHHFWDQFMEIGEYSILIAHCLCTKKAFIFTCYVEENIVSYQFKADG